MNTNSASCCPPEILCLIFAHLTPPDLEPLAAVGNNSPWSQALRTTKAAVLVCRSWANAAVETLYKDIYLHRIGQLPSLVRTLEGKEPSANNKQGKWVVSIQYDFYVPPAWNDVYSQDLRRLFGLCPSLRKIGHNPRFDSYLSRLPQDRVDLLSVLTLGESEGLKKPCLNITDLTLGEGEGAGIYAHTHLLTSFKMLQRLVITVDQALCRRPINDPQPCVELPCLHTLVCDVPSVIGYGNLQLISRRWKLPALCDLTIKLSWSYDEDELSRDPLASQNIFDLCAAHGQALTSLRFDNRKTQRNIDGLTEVIKLCPKLEQIVFPPDMVPLLALTQTHQSLRRIDLFGQTSSMRLSGLSAKDHFEVLFTNTHLPALRTIRLLDPRLSGDRIDTTFMDADYITLLNTWFDQFRAVNVQLENVDGNALAFMDPSIGGTGPPGGFAVDEDDVDDSYRGDSDGSDVESNGNSTDSSQSFPEWDSEDEELGPVVQPVQDQIDHNTALAIFEETLHVSAYLSYATVVLNRSPGWSLIETSQGSGSDIG